MTPDPSASEILARVADVYAQARTYEDEGEDVTVFTYASGPGRRSTSRKPFRTAFIRPDQFFFEFREAHSAFPRMEWTHYVAWIDSGVPSVWSTIRGSSQAFESIARAMGSLAGVSSGIASMAPVLFTPGSTAPCPLPDPTTAHCTAREQIDGSDCWRIDGQRFNHELVNAWIDATSFLVRRITCTRQFGAETHERSTLRMRQALAALSADDPNRSVFERTLEHHERIVPQQFQTQSTTTWSPRIDTEIDPSVLCFVPPSSSS